MKKYIRSSDEQLIQEIEAIPQCGKDFCDSCGDCLHCYGEDKCIENKDGHHLWIEYLDETYAQHNFGFVESEPHDE